MKAIMISIQPKWCELIASGKKTIEVRKTKPKIDVPFKCYIYMTYGKTPKIVSIPTDICFAKMSIHDAYPQTANGKVVGEFVCDKIENFSTDYRQADKVALTKILKNACLTFEECANYDNGKCLYAWHISDLKIYDKFEQSQAVKPLEEIARLKAENAELKARLKEE